MTLEVPLEFLGARCQKCLKLQRLIAEIVAEDRKKAKKPKKVGCHAR